MTHFAKTFAKTFAIVTVLVSSFLTVPATMPAAAASVGKSIERAESTHELVRSAVKRVLEKRRALQIDRLEAYLKDGVFPRNRVAQEVVNIFRDGDGLLCAVAFLIDSDGLKTLVDETAKANNQVKIGTVKDGKLLQWVLASGLTQAEIAMVQLPDSPIAWDREWVNREDLLVRTHLTNAIAVLKKNSDASLELATDRLLQRFAAAVHAS